MGQSNSRGRTRPNTQRSTPREIGVHQSRRQTASGGLGGARLAVSRLAAGHTAEERNRGDTRSWKVELFASIAVRLVWGERSPHLLAAALVAELALEGSNHQLNPGDWISTATSIWQPRPREATAVAEGPSRSRMQDSEPWVERCTDLLLTRTPSCWVTARDILGMVVLLDVGRREPGWRGSYPNGEREVRADEGPSRGSREERGDRT